MNRWNSAVAAILLSACCSLFQFGCTQKDIRMMDARPSAEWVKQSIIYEIDFRSDSKIKSFHALESRVPELKKLGFNVISLYSIYPIGDLNRKGLLGNPFAIKDFYSINWDFGTLDDLKSLIHTIHRHDLKFIIPLSISQAAWDSQLLMEHPEWFVQNDEGAIVSPDTESSDVAQLDFHQHELRKYMIAMMKFWIRDMDVDGFHCYNQGSIPTGFWNIARSELDRIKPVIMVSECRSPELHTEAFDVSRSWDLDGLRKSIGEGKVSASVIHDSLTTEIQRFPKESLHLRNGGNQLEWHKDLQEVPVTDPETPFITAGLALTLPGIPSLPAGLVPVQSTAGASETTMIERVIALRRMHPSLVNGSYHRIPNSDSIRIFSFMRISGEDSVLIVFNFAHQGSTAIVHLPARISGEWRDEFSNAFIQAKNSELKIDLEPTAMMVLVPESKRRIP